MKLLRYGSAGEERPGIVDENGRIRDLSSVVDDISGEVLSQRGLDLIRKAGLETLPLVEGTPRIGPCVAGVSKIVGVGLNYHDHAMQIGAAPPTRPVLFQKATSSISGPHDCVVRPPGSTKLDWEVEVAVVIGSVARNVGREEALAHVAGYCLFNDITERAFIEQSGQMLDGKCADTFSPLGPWLVTRDEISDPSALDLFLAVNGETMQRGNTRTMIFDIPTLISHISGLMTLLPGDIITTGTPPGVGMRMSPPRFLQAGDVMTLSAPGLGEQSQRVE